MACSSPIKIKHFEARGQGEGRGSHYSAETKALLQLTKYQGKLKHNNFITKYQTAKETNVLLLLYNYTVSHTFYSNKICEMKLVFQSKTQPF